LLGIRIERGELSVYPCVPDNFGTYSVEYKKGGATYAITVEIIPGYEGPAQLSMDGEQRGKTVVLDKAEGVHKINACWKR
jgi:cellobiose phosphorylase